MPTHPEPAYQRRLGAASPGIDGARLCQHASPGGFELVTKRWLGPGPQAEPLLHFWFFRRDYRQVRATTLGPTRWNLSSSVRGDGAVHVGSNVMGDGAVHVGSNVDGRRRGPRQLERETRTVLSPRPRSLALVRRGYA